MSFLTLCFVALAVSFGSAQDAETPMMVVVTAETPADVSYHSISGLGYNPSPEDDEGKPVYYAISDDPTEGADMTSQPRSFDISVLFGEDGLMDAKPTTIYQLPKRTEGLRPEGLDFCGTHLYFGDKKMDREQGFVHRFEPETADIVSSYPLVDYGTPLEGVTVRTIEGEEKRMYTIYRREENGYVHIDEYDTSRSGEEPLRSFTYHLDGARATDILWEGGESFLVLEAFGEDLGDKEEARLPRPDSMALYRVVIPESAEGGKLEKEEVGRWTMDPTNEAEAVDTLLFTSGSTSTSAPFARQVVGFEGVLPYWDGLSFGPDAFEGKMRTLILVSDNFAHATYPTRYATMLLPRYEAATTEY